MVTDFAKQLVEQMKDEYTSIAEDGVSSAEFTGYLDTGCYLLNALFSGSLYGGVPNNKIAAFAGLEATGKTFFVLSIVKHFLDKNPDGVVIYYDTESAVTKNMMKTRGIDTKRVIISEPETIQKFRTHVLNMVRVYEEQKEKTPMLMVLDSLGQMSTTKEMEDSEAGKDTRDMTRAQLVKGTFRTIRLKLARAGIPMLLTNHVYVVVGAYVPTKELSGGSGVKYASDAIAILTKKKDKDKTTKEVSGNLITVAMQKSRLSKENTQGTVNLSYEHGLRRYSGLIELGLKYDIFKMSGAYVEFPDGSKAYEKTINADPEKYFTSELMDMLEEAANKEYMYGDASEEEVEEYESAED